MIGILENRRHSRLKDLLSAYIDGQVSESEAIRVEEHLSGCDECRRELGTLRATVELLGQLPEIAPQRAYTLSAPPEPAGRGWPVTWTARAATSLAGLLVVALLLGDAFGIVMQQDVRETASLPAVAPAAASREIEREVVVEREVIKEVVKETAVEAVVEKEVVTEMAPVAEMAVPAPREVDEAVVVEMEVVKEVEAPVAEMAAPAPMAAPVTAAAAPAQAMAPPTDVAQAEAPTAASPEAAERGVQVELKRESEVKATPDDDGALETPVPVAPAVSAPAEDAAAPEADDGLALPLWQVEVAAAALFLALVLGMVWSARRTRRPWG